MYLRILRKQLNFQNNDLDVLMNVPCFVLSYHGIRKRSHKIKNHANTIVENYTNNNSSNNNSNKSNKSKKKDNKKEM